MNRHVSICPPVQVTPHGRPAVHVNARELHALAPSHATYEPSTIADVHAEEPVHVTLAPLPFAMCRFVHALLPEQVTCSAVPDTVVSRQLSVPSQDRKVAMKFASRHELVPAQVK